MALLLVTAPSLAREVPFLSGRVVDEANILSTDSEALITQQLEQLEAEKGAQIAVLTVDSLEGEDLQGFAFRTAETWKLGREKFDDGALFLVSVGDRKMRIEVGYGLEPSLTDAQSRRILDEIVRPHFKAGDMEAGVRDGVQAIDAIVRGNENLLPEPSVAPAASQMDLGGRAMMLLVFVMTVGLFSLVALASEGCMSWFLYLFLMPFWGTFPMVIFGGKGGFVLFLIWALGFPILRLLLPKSIRNKLPNPGGRTWTSGRGWIPTGGWSSGGGFSGGGGGGFSGGGGSFGGGGASSGW